MRSKLLILVAFCLIAANSYCQVLQWNTYNTNNSGLISDDIRAAAFETNGTAWFGHGSGINRFDGVSWTSYNTFNSPLPFDQINAICIDNVNSKWFGTDEGLAKFDGTNWTIYTTGNSSIPDNRVKALLSDASGNIWIGTESAGVVKFNGSTWTAYNSGNSGFGSNSITALAIENGGTVWATGNGGASSFNGTSWTHYNTGNSTLPSNALLSVAIDNSNNKWFGTQINGLVKWNGSVFTNYTTQNSGLADNTVLAVLSDASGLTWAGTGNGLSSFNGTIWNTYRTNNSGLANNLIFCLAKQSASKLWAGTAQGASSFCFSFTPIVTATSTQLCGAGQSSILSTTAGAGLTYQWKLNGNNIGGATNTSYTTSAAGNYTVVTTNSGGCAANSTATTVTVNAPASFTQQPANVIGCIGSTAQFTCAAVGCGLTYRWQRLINGVFTNLSNNTTFGGTLTQTLTVSNVDASMNGWQFRCRIQGTYAPTLSFSNPALFTVNTTPDITLSNLPGAVCSPININLTSVIVTDANNSIGTISYLDNNLLPVANPAEVTQSGTYTIRKTSTCNVSDSAPVVVTINPVPALITSDPTPICKPGVISLQDNPIADSNNTTGTYSYWLDQALTLPVANPDSITLSNQFYVLKTTTENCRDTVGVYITIGTKVVVQPKNQSVCLNGIAHFDLEARGVGLSYQWQVSDASGLIFTNINNDAYYSGVATPNLTVTINGNIALSGRKYRCRIGTTCPNPVVNSAPKTLTVLPDAQVTLQPVDVTVCALTQVNFKIEATGENLRYRWQRQTGFSPWANLQNTGTFQGVTTDSLRVTAKAGFTQHQYRCIVFSDCANDTSFAATLYVGNTVIDQSLNETVCVADTGYFSVDARAVNIVYTWQQQIGNGVFTNLTNSAIFAGVNTSQLMIKQPPITMDGYKYRCRISGSCIPSVFSKTKVLNVVQNPSPIIITQHPANATLCENQGAEALFVVGAQAQVTLGYQWQYFNVQQNKWLNISNNAFYSGAKNDSLYVAAEPSLNGLQYRCAVLAYCPPFAVSNPATLTVDSCGEIPPAANGNDNMTIYPNPADQTLSLSFATTRTEALTLTILDNTGRIIEKINCANSMNRSLDVQNYPDGIYHLMVESQSGSNNHHMFIVQHN
ncbi:MAG: two-component regulator propeller domain-containing protein [Flavobacteriales bacterium]